MFYFVMMESTNGSCGRIHTQRKLGWMILFIFKVSNTVLELLFRTNVKKCLKD